MCPQIERNPREFTRDSIRARGAAAPGRWLRLPFTAHLRLSPIPRPCYPPRMRSPPFLAAALATTASVFAADLGELIFQDDFNRKAAQETTDDPGNGWGTNSKARAQGDK